MAAQAYSTRHAEVSPGPPDSLPPTSLPLACGGVKCIKGVAQLFAQEGVSIPANGVKEWNGGKGKGRREGWRICCCRGCQLLLASSETEIRESCCCVCSMGQHVTPCHAFAWIGWKVAGRHVYEHKASKRRGYKNCRKEKNKAIKGRHGVARKKCLAVLLLLHTR